MSYADVRIGIDNYGEYIVVFCTVEGCRLGETLTDYPVTLASILARVDAHECPR